MSTVSSLTLVGRDEELLRLRQAWQRAARGEPLLVLLAGEAGIGKSRLLRELTMHVESADGLALTGSCLHLGDVPLPYAPVASMLRRLARTTDTAAREALERLGPDLAAIVPSLRPATGAGAVPLTEPAARARLFEAVLGLLGALAGDRGVLLAFEDVHWADPATRDLLTFLVRNHDGERLLVVLTLRTDGLAQSDPVVAWAAELMRAVPHERLDLDRLGPADVRRQVEAITGRAEPALVDAVWRRSEGNPFFVEELLAANVAGPGGLGGPPRTLAEVLLGRAALLSPDAGKAVRAIAVAGTPLAEATLAAVLGIEEAKARDVLREPIDAGLVRIDDAGRVRPRHALLAEVVEGALLAGERRELHASLAAALEAAAVTRDTPGEAAARAWHWDLAGRPEAAYPAHLVAGEEAAGAHAWVDAERHLARALELAAGEGVNVAPPERLEVVGRAVEAADLAGDTEAAIRWAEEALAAVDPVADPWAAGVLHGKLGYLFWVAGRPEAALDAHRSAVALVPADPPTAARARVLASLGGALMGAGRYAESRTHCEEAVRVAAAAGAVPEESRARNMLGSDLVALGRVDEGIDELRAARRLAEAAGPGDMLVVAHHNLALNLLLAGRHDEAVSEAFSGREVARRLELTRRYDAHLAGVAADALFRSGRWREAAALADEALAGGPGARANVHLTAVRARVHAGRGEVDAASALLAAVPAEELDPDLAAYLALARAETLRGSGDAPSAITAAEAGLSALDGSDDEASRLPLLALLAELRADEARAAAGRGDLAAALDETERVAHLAGTGDEIAARLMRPAPLAFAARTAAEAARAAGTAADGSAWERAARRAREAGLLHLAAEADARLAAVLLAQRRDRARAEVAVREAWRVADELGDARLLATVRVLAGRARVDLAEADAGGAAVASRPLPATTLSERELQVLRLVAAGRTNGEIAAELFITRKTASSHVTHILDKLGVGNRLEAAMAASRLGLLEEGSGGAGG